MPGDMILLGLAGVIAAGAPIVVAVIGETLTERAGVINLSLNGVVILSAMMGFWAAVATDSILLGLMGGLLLAYNVTPIINTLQKMLGTSLITESVYFGLDYLPSKVELADVLAIISVAFAMSLLATIYPAWSASRTQPAQALRYE